MFRYVAFLHLWLKSFPWNYLSRCSMKNICHKYSLKVNIKRRCVDKSIFFVYLATRFVYYIFSVHIFKSYSL